MRVGWIASVPVLASGRAVDYEDIDFVRARQPSGSQCQGSGSSAARDDNARFFSEGSDGAGDARRADVIANIRR